MSMHRLVFITIMLITTVLSFSQPSEKLLQKAEKGNAKAQYEYAREIIRYKHDTAQAVNWYRRAAEQSYTSAYYELAMIYDNKKDYAEAAKWCEKCSGGLPWEMVARYYKKGQGVEKDYAKAAYWYEKALLSHKKENKIWIGFIDQRTMVCLAECCDSIKNYTSALNWYNEVIFGKYASYAKTDEYAMADALVGMIRLYHLGLGVQKDKSKVNSLLSLLRRILGSINVAPYAIETAINRDDEMSLFWTEYAVNNNSVIGMYRMGRIYEEGKYGIGKNDEKAFEWYQKAVDEKYIDAYFRLGLMYEKGRAVPKNYEHAYKLYMIVSDYCANIDNKSYLLQEAMGRLGVMYYYGHYVDMDQDKAFGFLLDGVYSFDDAEVMKTLSSCYRYGKGTTEDVEKAEYWLAMAEKYGDETAIWLRELERTRNEINANK